MGGVGVFVYEGGEGFDVGECGVGFFVVIDFDVEIFFEVDDEF